MKRFDRVDQRAAGDGARKRGNSPFTVAAPTITLALIYAALAGVYVAVGSALPGDRWVAIHLFTLGVLTNIVLVFSEHFGRTVTRTSGERAAWWPLVTNLGIIGVILGAVLGLPLLLAAGASTVTASVFAAYRRLRRMRRAAIGARFTWIARVYERAHGAFIHGAVFGALLGTGVVSGRWYGPTLFAHLHANVLGWGGLTLLATLVFFGPTMARTRIESKADDRAARALRIGATGLTVAILLLVVSGLPGVWGPSFRMAAAAGLAVYAWAATVVCVPVARAVWHGRPTASRPVIVALCTWFVVVVWLDVIVVAAGAWRWLDTVGIMALAGVLAQAIMATLLYLTPMLRGHTTDARARLSARLERGAWSRVVVFNIGIVGVAVGAGPFAVAEPLLVAGWSMIGLALLPTVGLAAAPVGGDDA